MMHGNVRLITLWSGVAAIVLTIAGFAYFGAKQKPSSKPSNSKSERSSSPQSKFRHQSFNNYTLWWDEIPEQIRAEGSPSGATTNIHRQDYAGPDACKNCHKKQYESWSQHPHRWMNSLVENTTVHGNFNDYRMPYMGGEVIFRKSEDQYRMRLERGEIRREYVVEQTIGSRYFQYYVGKQLEGPEQSNHPVYSEAHVLPLGYWLDRQEWVPIVHVHPEVKEGERHDPFVPRAAFSGDMNQYSDQANDLYRSQCNFCHTTFPIGDMFLRSQRTIGRHVPTNLDVSLADYVQGARPQLWPAGRAAADISQDEFVAILHEYRRSEAKIHAVTLGVSCEACHLGAKAHAEGKLKRPEFFPSSSEVIVRSDSSEYDRGRTHDNVNWACGRCHAGERPQYANGTATWNSTEFTDAMRGSCYSQLTCVRCHNPHEAIGQKWSKTPIQDDAICLSCHQKYEPEQARQAHTHHSLDNEGSRCMNCHMPRINEGLQEVVRTHTIFSPTNKSMIESNQTNACNQCHVEQPIDWTLTHLKDWYGKSYSKRQIGTSYPDRKQPVAIGWLKSDQEAVRLIAADALSRADARWALPDLIRALDDPFILNRQFARIGLERMLSLKLSEFGYRFYQTQDERVEPLKKLSEHLQPEQERLKSASR